MKILSQSPDEMVLQEGNASGIAVGVVFVLAGILGGYFLHASSPYAKYIALAVVALGAGVICFASSITVDANKSKGELLYRKKRLIGGQTAIYTIADILRIETRKIWRIENATPPANREAGAPPQPVLVAQSVIVFKSGKELALDHQKTSSTTQIGSAVLMSGQGAETAMATQVANFLGVPFQEIAPPPMGMGMNMGGGGINIQY